MRERAADQRLLELLEVGRVPRLALQVGRDERVELDEFLLGPLPELRVRDVVVPQRKLLFELFGRALEVELQVVVDGCLLYTSDAADE